MSHLRKLFAVAAVSLLAVPAAAAAHPGHRGYHWTYPYASRLCAQVAAGHVPKKLAGDTSQITAACGQLNTSFTAAQNAYTTATAPLRQQAVTALQQLRQTCRQAWQSHNPAACQQARQQTLVTLKNLRAKVKPAAQAYYSAIQDARKTFWATIRGLRGGSSVPEDRTAGPAPASPIPSNASVKD